MPCNTVVVKPIQVKTEIKNVNKLEQVLADLGFKQVETGENVSYYVGSTKRDAKLVIRPQRITLDGKVVNITGDVAFVPDKSNGMLKAVYAPGSIPENALQFIMQAYAKKLIKDEAKEWGGFLTDEQTDGDGNVTIRIGDPTGKTTMVKINKDGTMSVQAFGGPADVCSPVASKAKEVLLGIAPHSHGPGGVHVHADGTSHSH